MNLNLFKLPSQCIFNYEVPLELLKFDYIRHVEAWVLRTWIFRIATGPVLPGLSSMWLALRGGRRGGKLHYVLRLQVTYQQQFIEPEWQQSLSPDGLLFPLLSVFFLSNWFSQLQFFYPPVWGELYFFFCVFLLTPDHFNSWV